MRVACIDVGLKRIGVALCLQSDVVFPHECILRKNRNQAANEVTKLLREWNIEKLIVGMPYGGSAFLQMQARIKHFVSLIEFENEIIFIDEYGSSIEAKEKTAGVFKQKKDGKIDSVAACIILQRYLGT